MVRLTEKSKTGLWHLRGVSWEQLREGHRITKTVNEKIYGALCKLKDYEDSGMNPDQAAEAAEKDTPMEPIRTEEGFCYTETYKCPRWSKEFQGTGIARYCYHCGQRLKWEE